MPERYGHQKFIPEIELWTSSYDKLLAFVESRVKESKTTFIITLNPLMVMERDKNDEFREALEDADILVADGQGVRWAARRIAGIDPPLIPGVELAEKLIEIASRNEWRVALIGAKEGVWEKASENLKARYPGLNVVGGNHGYYKKEEEPELIDRLASLNPLLFIAGMGFPKQEMFLNRYKDRFPGAILIGVGGSLDVYSGLKKRAPGFFRKTGVEWLWRMIVEPKRIGNFGRLVRFWLWVNFKGH